MKCSIPPATHHTVLSVLSSGKIFSVSSMLRSHCNVCDVIYLLRRRMPWLEDRWRTQRTVLNISNCRFPRKKRILNAFCELTSCQLTWLAVTEICSRSNSEVWVVSHVVASSCADVFVWFSASLVFEQHYEFVFMMFDFSFVFFVFWKHYFHARSRPVTGLPAEFKHINKRRTSN